MNLHRVMNRPAVVRSQYCCSQKQIDCPVYFKLKSAADTHCPAKVEPVKLDLVETP